jgi:hypothetical protein
MQDEQPATLGDTTPDPAREAFVADWAGVAGMVYDWQQSVTRALEYLGEVLTPKPIDPLEDLERTMARLTREANMKFDRASRKLERATWLDYRGLDPEVRREVIMTLPAASASYRSLEEQRAYAVGPWNLRGAYHVNAPCSVRPIIGGEL